MNRKFFNTQTGQSAGGAINSGSGDHVANLKKAKDGGAGGSLDEGPVKPESIEEAWKEIERLDKELAKVNADMKQNLQDLTGIKHPQAVGFDVALQALKNGRRVARQGWNGKNMFLYLVPGSQFKVAEGRPLAAHLPVGTDVTYHAHIDMKTAQDTHVPWLASQTDVLAEDWIIY